MLGVAGETLGESKLLKIHPYTYTRESAKSKTKADRAKAQKAQIKISAKTDKRNKGQVLLAITQFWL